MKNRIYDELVLAIRPTPRGFSYVVFEAPLSPIDWGICEVSGEDKNTSTVEAAARLCKRIRPDTLVLEDRSHSSSKRHPRIVELHEMLSALAQQHGIDLACYSRSTIRSAFHHGMITRYQIAQAIAAFIPAFEDRLPPPRKLWKSEDPRLWLFDAASLAMTHFAAIAGTNPP